MSKISIRGVKKSFGGRAVLDGVDLEIDQGESRVIIGKSGSGKSVTLRHLLGLVMPDAGEISIEGQKLTRANRYAQRLKFGMLFQGAALFDSLNVEENIAFAMVEHTRMTRAEIAARVAECLDMVGLPGIQKRMPAELSGGMRKRVGLARAVSMKPEIMLFDEPTTGLDPLTADAINQLMVQLKAKLQTTCVVVTHDMASAYKVGDRISMLHEGRIRVTATPAQIRSTADPLVKAFVEGNWSPDNAPQGNDKEKAGRR